MMISRKKYNFLKQFPNTLSENEKAQIYEYENSKIVIKYSIPEEKINTPLAYLPYKWLCDEFVKTWEANEKTKLILTEETKPIYRGVTQYFARLEVFESTKITENIPKLNKGILIIGDYGCGKTSMLKAFKSVGSTLLPDPILWFSKVSCNALVAEFESLNSNNKSEKKYFFKKYNNAAVIYFDDFGTESNASNFGIKNLLKDILEERYDNKKRTLLTSNLSLSEIEQKYGKRIFDRLQEMFNIIQMPGKSFRK
tara:strand:- start:41 stop:802 length:762 start_codon:yes stop_codon:yes gene_type:complete